MTLGGTTRFLHDGESIVAEYNGSGTLTHRYVHWAGDDAPLLSYAGADLSQPSYLHADQQGSIVMVSSQNGAPAINRYDEYGIPQSTNTGRFQYTGQAFLPEVGLYYYRARIYSPTLGRFLQTDPIGYGDGMNFHAYVGNDPVNHTDPSGLGEFCWYVDATRSDGNGGVIVDSRKVCAAFPDDFGSGWSPWQVAGEGGGGGGSPGPTPSGQPPAYCNSVGYRIGDFIDRGVGGTTQTLGAGIVVGGLAIGLATAITGVGAGAGGAVAGAGGAIYAGGTAISIVGTGVKWLSGQDNLVTAGALLSLPTMRLSPVAQVITEQALSRAVGRSVRDPCQR